MRVTGGRFGGLLLSVPKTDALRPTQDRVREALFSMLQGEMSGAAFLDLFAGSGAVGLEALSRGAASVTFVEQDARHLTTVRSNVAALERSPSANGHLACETVRADVYRWLATYAGAGFTVGFADPPYALGLVPETLSLLLRCGRVKPTSVIVCETANEDDVFMGDAALAEKFTVARAARYGAAFVTFLRPKEA